MEILLQIILEPMFYAYFDLVESLIGGKKLKKWQEHLLKISCLIVFIIAFFLVLIGAFWVNDAAPFKTYGIIFLITGSIILFAHILIGLFVGTNRFVEKSRKEEILLNEHIEENKPTPQIYHIDSDNNNQDNV